MADWRQLLVPGILVLSRAADLGSTWFVGGGGLDGERNVLHVAFGIGWSGLVAITAILLAILIPAWLWATRNQHRFMPKARGLGFWPFTARLAYGRPVPYLQMLWRVPPGPRLGWIMARFGTWAMIVVSFVAATGNLVGASGPAGARFWGALIMAPAASWTTIGVTVTVVFVAWLAVEHARYRTLPRTNGKARAILDREGNP